MSDKQVRQVDKLLAQESKLDEQKVERAKAELKKAEKAHQKSIKVRDVFSRVIIFSLPGLPGDQQSAESL